VKVSVLEAAAAIEADKIKTKVRGMMKSRSFILLPDWGTYFMGDRWSCFSPLKILSEESSMLISGGSREQPPLQCRAASQCFIHPRNAVLLCATPLREG
jgi:hypothetical protein